ncbi:MAG: dTDP-4-dehydrorhamnose 3,5-epimerase [Oscillospiraceae bacterium]|nr:dTDP-4-dehydrorhamnose 3,5-epimerase [Oscillospiraceae bacterium]
MGKIKVEPVEGFEGLCVITPTVFTDCRGDFSEVYSKRDLEEAGLFYDFVQENQIYSRRGALRGMHYQRCYPQAKLIRVVCGRMFDAVVDIRPDSVSYGKWYGIELSAENKKQLLIPRGFAHGCLTLSEGSVCTYYCDEFYAPGDDGGFMWNDPAVGIVWPVKTPGNTLQDGSPLILLQKDLSWPPFE